MSDGTLRSGVGAGLLLVLATACLSGVSTFVNLFAVRGTGSDAFVTVRNIAVTAMLVPLFLAAPGRRAERRALSGREWATLGLVGVIGGAVPFLLFFHGLSMASAEHGATTASFVYRTLFLFAGLFGVVFLRERLKARYLLGAALLLGGSYLLLSLSSPVGTDGALFVLAATVLWAAEYTVSKRLLASLPSSTVALGRMGFGAAVLAGYLVATAQWSTVGRFTPAQWEWVGLSALLLCAFVTTWYAGLARVDLHVASSVLVAGYPVSWLLSVAAGSQGLTLADAAAALAVVAGAGVVAGLARLRASWSWVTGAVTPGRTAR